MTSSGNAGAGNLVALRHRTFAVLWVATVLGNTGTFMRDVASGWLMTDLSASPAAVALIQAAGSLPIFLLAIPAGVLADVIDRRRLLILVQLLLAGVSASLFTLAQAGELTVALLIALTFLGGIGAALMAPVWQAIVPDLVPRGELRSAVTLNSLGVNIARAVGPAAGGILVASLGAAFAYGLDVVSCGIAVAALIWWRTGPRVRSDLAETFSGGMRAGLRYARASRNLHRMMVRAIGYFAFASAVWALLPLIARDLLQGDARFYGLLLGAVGVGAIIGALLLDRLRKRLDADGSMLLAAICTAAAIAGLALQPSKSVALALMLLLGASWIVALTTLGTTMQSVLPNWVRGRGLSIYLMVFNGALAAGSLLWGLIAQWTGIAAALLIAAAALAMAAFVLWRWRLPDAGADLEPARHWPVPAMAKSVAPDRGPVMVLVHYRVPIEEQMTMHALMHRLSEERRRDGASEWGLFEDAADAQHVVEWFVVESWAEHMRHHDRVSHADARLQHELQRYSPVVGHFVAVDAAR
jgi:MFS family permease